MTSKIMVVDDDPGFRTTLVEILEEDGLADIAAEDGYQAIQMATDSEIALILMDIQMPGINGVETFLEIKEIRPDCAVAMMTGYAADSLAKQALADGAMAILQKPLAFGQIFEIIEKVLHEAASA